MVRMFGIEVLTTSITQVASLVLAVMKPGGMWYGDTSAMPDAVIDPNRQGIHALPARPKAGPAYRKAKIAMLGRREAFREQPTEEFYQQCPDGSIQQVSFSS